MIPNIISTISAITIFSLSGQNIASTSQELSSHEISLEIRQEDRWVNEIFKDNILLNMAYLEGKINSAKDINWDEVRKPFQYEFRLNPNETFAYHGDVLPEYEGKVSKTTNAHFNAADGFKSSGYLFGDGVCHLASLIYWVAKDAGLETYTPTSHDFMPIPEISKEYGVSIYFHPNDKSKGQRQNLYITNNRENDVIFKFQFNGDNLKLSVADENF